MLVTSSGRVNSIKMFKTLVIFVHWQAFPRTTTTVQTEMTKSLIWCQIVNTSSTHLCWMYIIVRPHSMKNGDDRYILHRLNLCVG